MLSKLFGFGKSKEAREAGAHPPVGSWAFLGTDMHSHLIPGIDDGAQTIDESIQLIERLRDMGYKNLITTPHIKFDHYPNTSAVIQQGLQDLKKALAEREIDMPIKAAAEYYIDDHFMDLLERKDLLTVKDNEVLVEISFMIEPIQFHEILFQIQLAGYRPILAHPERYAFYHEKKDAYNDLKNRGCLLQLNVLALSGYYGKPVRQVAEKSLKEGLYAYCGTDMHHIRHADGMYNMLSANILKELEVYPFHNSRLEVPVV